MRITDHPRSRALAAWTAALGFVVLLGAAVPGTSSAFTASVTNSSDTAASKARFVCADTFAGDARRSKAFFEFALDETADAATAVDSSDAGNPGTYRGVHGTDTDSPTACPYDGGAAYRLDGGSSHVSTSRWFPPIMHDFSEEIWFKTTSPGKLMGFEATVDDRSNNYDKHLYVDTSGHLVYGIYNGSIQTIATPAAVNDGLWHQAVATTSSSGSVLYLDGREAASRADFTTAEGFSGYWRIGWGNLDSWPGAPGGSNWFTGSVRFAAAYPYVLSAQEVAAAASNGAPATRPDPTASASASPSASASASASPSASASDPSPSASASEASSDSPSASAVPVRGAHPSMGTIEQAPTTEDTLAAAPDQ